MEDGWVDGWTDRQTDRHGDFNIPPLVEWRTSEEDVHEVI